MSKLWRIYILMALTVILVAGSAAALIQTVLLKNSIKGKVEELNGQVQALSAQYAKGPSVEMLRVEFDIIEKIQMKFQKSSAVHVWPEDSHVIDPVRFKEELLQFDTDVRKRSKENKVILPDDLGFAGVKDIIPNVETLAVLVVAKGALSEILDCVFTASIPRVVELGFSDERAGENKAIYVTMNFISNFSELNHFLFVLEGLGNHYIIRSLFVEKIANVNPSSLENGPGQIACEIAIELILKEEIQKKTHLEKAK